MKIITLAESDENSSRKVEKEEWVNVRRKDFINSLEQDLLNGTKRVIEYVNSAPEKFQLGVFYILKDGERVWVTT